MKPFRTDWWTIEVPIDWTANQDPECATFLASPPIGALQISAAKKDNGLATDDDLRDFAGKHIEAGRALQHVHHGTFAGFAVEHVTQGRYWKEWWLRADNLMVFATYNCDEAQKGLEDSVAEVILSSLRLRT